MSEIITFPLPLGPNYTIPDVGDENWGQEVTNFLVAIPNGVMPTQGSFALTGDVTLGATYGLVAAHFISSGSNPALTGFLRLDKTDTLSWRNNANSADLALGINGSDLLTFNGVTMGFTGGVGTASQYQLAYYAANGNSVAGLTLITGHKAIASDANGLPTASSTTDTELGYVHGVTSAIQTQLSAISTVANAALPETGGTMSGNIAMGSNSITGLANGVNPQDAATVGQLPTNTVPVGAISMYGGNSAPSGWLLCDGTSYLRATYPSLFAAIGTTFGSVDGTHFTVPSMTNYLPIGAGSSAALGANAGSTTVNITDPTHNHTQDAHGHIGTSAQVGADLVVPTTSGGSDWPYGTSNVFTTNTVVAGTNDGGTTIAFANTSTTTATNQANSTGITATALPPVLGLTFIIKT